MPKYLDNHPMPNLPPEAVNGMAAQIKAGKADKFGAKGLNVFIGKNGQGWCLTEAPNADAVCKSHEAMGIKLPAGQVTEVSTLV